MKSGHVWRFVKWLFIGACIIWLFRFLQGGIPNPKEVWTALNSIPWYWHAAAIVSASANWWIESIKWRLLVSNLENLRPANAVKGLLVGAAANNIIPFRVGEFLGRVLYLKEENRPAALLNNYFGATCQTLVTLIAGIPAAYSLLGPTARQYSKNSIFFILPLLLIMATAWLLLKSRNQKPLWLEKFLTGFRHFSVRQIAGTLLLSCIRFGIFGGFYALFLISFELADIPTALTGVACIFFVQTFTPGMVYTDAAVRLSLPLLVFSLTAAQKPLLLAIAFINYFYNVLLPAIIGIVIFTLHKWKQQA